VDIGDRQGDADRMGALPRPHLAPGPHRELVDALHTLHHRAGWPSLRHLAADTGVSHTTVSKALSSPTLPSWGTVELLVEAMGGDVARFHELWLAASAPPDPTRRPGVAIAGRAEELDVVRRHLADGAGLLLVTGEAGMGKTALVGAAAASSETTVVTGPCLHLSREVPLLPIIEALRTLHDTDDGRWVGTALRACPAYVGSSLARLLPELGAPSSSPSEDPWGGERLLSAVGRLLQAMAAIRPVALHVEDCQWADRSTLDLLAHLTSTSSPVPLVATWRTGDPDVPQDHVDWLTRVRWTTGVTTVDLETLTLEESVEQLRLLTGSAPDPADAERIHARSQGLPLYTAQLAGSPADVELPPHLADLLDRRIGDLDEDSWRVARLLGVAQRRLRSKVLSTAGGMEAEALEASLRTLAGRGLVTTGPGEDAALSHPLFVDAIHRRLVPGEGARVHARLAEALVAEPDVEPAEVADHWRAADRPSRELVHRVAAARRADERFAPRQALDEWLRVLELWDAGERVEGVDMWDAVVRALEAASQLGDLDAARGLAPRLDARGLTGQRRAVALQWTASLEMADGRPQQGLALLDEALALFEGRPPSHELDELLAERVVTFMQLGRFDDARTELRRGLEVGRVLDDERSRRRWTAFSMWVTMRSGDLEGAVAIGREALLSASARPDPMADIELAVTTTDVMLHTAAAASEVEAMASGTLKEIEAYDLTLSNGAVLLRGNLAWAYLVQGDVHTAREWLRPVTASAPDPNTALVHYLLAAIELREGDVQRAVDRCRDASAQISAHGQSWIDGVPWLAEVELWAGRVDAALRVLDEALQVTLPTQALMTAALVSWHARAHAERLDRAHASASDRLGLVQQLRAAVASARTDPFGVADCDVSVPASRQSWLAELSRIDGTESVAGWASAAAEWDRIRRPHDAAYCRWRAAEVALRHGEGTTADRLLKRAATGARTHLPLAQAIAATARRAK
jgi:tetratricopeptide (TPR) repeat protein